MRLGHKLRGYFIMEILSDEKLVAEYLAGDEKALRILIGRYLKPVYNFVYRYVASAGDAEDIVQDVFASVWKNIKKFDQNKSFKTWIFSIAKNASLGWIKKKKPSLFSEFNNKEGDNSLVESIEDSSPLPDELFVRADLAKKLASAMEKLSPNYRIVLLLHYNDHFTFQEISESLGEPLNTVKSRHRRAIISLRKLLIL